MHFFPIFDRIQQVQLDSLSTPNTETLPSTTIKHPDHLGSLRIVDAICRTESNRKLNCRVAFVSENSALFVAASSKQLIFAKKKICSVAIDENHLKFGLFPFSPCF